MSLQHSPKIVTDGLVLALDAANRKSYPGSGTDWADISGTTITGSLINGPTFSAANNGSIVFAGDNDYVNVSYPSAITSSPAFTIECVVKADATTAQLSTYQRIVTWTSGSRNLQLGLARNVDATDGSERVFYIVNTTSAGFPLFSVANIPTGSIYHVVATFNGTATYQMYLNGIAAPNATFSSLPATGVVSANTFFIGQRGDSAGYLNGNIYTVKLYNRVLSPTEVLQNFNATRGRFGV